MSAVEVNYGLTGVVADDTDEPCVDGPRVARNFEDLRQQ
mgnify:CR=1 FL=1